MMSFSNNHVNLPDGRALSYCRLGESGCRLVIFIGGLPGSRLMVNLFAGEVPAGICLVGIDRPGMGRSDFKPGWDMRSFAADIARLADHFEAQHFSVLGWSGGAPYAAACALEIPERVSTCGLAAPMGAPEIVTYGGKKLSTNWANLAQRAPWSLRPVVWWRYGLLGTHSTRFKEVLVEKLPLITGADRQAFEREDILSSMSQGLAEAFAQGTRGQSYEIRLLYRPWGFSYADIRHPRLFIWQGEQDQVVEPSSVHAIADSLPRSQATFYPDEGHLSILTNHAKEILAVMAQ